MIGRKVSELTEADTGSCMRQRKRIDDGQDGIIVLVVSFVADGRIEGRIDGRVLVMSFLYSEYGGTQANGITQERETDRCGKR